MRGLSILLYTRWWNPTLDLKVGEWPGGRNEKLSFASFILEEQLWALKVISVLATFTPASYAPLYLLPCKKNKILRAKRGIDSSQ